MIKKDVTPAIVDQDDVKRMDAGFLTSERGDSRS
jgi:hypothetical protein